MPAEPGSERVSPRSRPAAKWRWPSSSAALSRHARAMPRPGSSARCTAGRSIRIRRGPCVARSWRAVATASCPRRPDPRNSASSSASDSTDGPRARSFSRGRSSMGQSRIRMRSKVRDRRVAAYRVNPGLAVSCRLNPRGEIPTRMKAEPVAALAGRKLLLCVCGGIAAYKSADLVRRLRDAGAVVQVAMTENAQRFVGAQTFQALSGLPVRTSLWDAHAEQAMGHLELARWADAILVAPATANTIAKLAHGFADDLVATLCLATTAPITLAPAMNHRMWRNPATQANVDTLRSRGVRFIGPADGPLAEGESGPGRMSEPMEIVAALAGAFA